MVKSVVQLIVDLFLHCHQRKTLISFDLLHLLNVLDVIEFALQNPFFEIRFLGKSCLQELVSHEVIWTSLRLGLDCLLDRLRLDWVCNFGSRLNFRLCLYLGLLFLNSGFCSFVDIIFIFMLMEIRVHLFILNRILQKLFNFRNIKMDFTIVDFLPFQFHQTFSCSHVFHHKVSIAIELSSFVFQENQIKDTFDFMLEMIENFNTLADVSHVGKLNSQRFPCRVAVQLGDVACYLLVVGIVLLFIIVVFGPSELFLELVFLVVIGAFRMLLMFVVF